MGKIRIKTLGDEVLEAKQKKETKKKKEAKMAQKAHLPGMEGGQRIAVVGPTEEELEKLAIAEGVEKSTEAQKGISVGSVDKSVNSVSARKKSKFAKTKKRSANYTAKVIEIDKNKSYPLNEALELLRKIKLAKFDETVELHINTTEAGISGQVKLPHGTGKEMRVAIATDELIEQIEKGKIIFDVLIAAPSMMPRLARVAKVLGPRGLMPNPKNGTISDNPEESMKKFQGGQINFKTESKTPLMHLTVGKTSFEDNQLAENINTIITAVKKNRIRKVVLKSTMSPAIKLQI